MRVAAALTVLAIYIAYLSVRIERQSTRDEAQPADVILVLGAAEYRGRPSPVLRARLDHALELYQQQTGAAHPHHRRRGRRPGIHRRRRGPLAT